MNGKVVVITGGNRGIGKATVEKFAAEKATVVFNSSKYDEKAEKFAEEMKNAYNTEVLYIPCDVRIESQIDNMIKKHYQFIHYNGLRRDKLRKMTNNFETNFFDDSVIIIDEAHNLISRIVNKIGKEKEITMDKTGKREKVNISIALILYEMLLTAQNARIVLLTGTPIINYPNEIGILFNILRGYIKTWEIPLDIKASQTVNKEVLQQIFTREKVMDYMDYSASSKVLTVTRNPYGFENKEKKGSGYHGVTNEKKTRKGERGELVLQERGIISDADFERRLIYIFKDNHVPINLIFFNNCIQSLIVILPSSVFLV
jgi:predicted ABC-type ATPase